VFLQDVGQVTLLFLSALGHVGENVDRSAVCCGQVGHGLTEVAERGDDLGFVFLVGVELDANEIEDFDLFAGGLVDVCQEAVEVFISLFLSVEMLLERVDE